MWKRLQDNKGLFVSREVVRLTLGFLDPEGVEKRLRHRLKRRKYVVPGPNYNWQIDGYDKLKPCGMCINGARDGFSRKIMWFEVGPWNNDPSVIAKYFLDCIWSIGGRLEIVRADKGTENGKVAAIQRFFRRNGLDEHSAEKSFKYGKSVSNQRIEAWWSTLKKRCSQWRMDHFKELTDPGYFSKFNIINTSNFILTETKWFHTDVQIRCFLHLNCLTQVTERLR